MVRENQIDGSLPCQNGTTKNPHTQWRHTETGAPLPDQHRQPIPEPILTLPWLPPAPPGVQEGAITSPVHSVAARYAYLHAALPKAQCFNLDAYAKHKKQDKYCIPDLRTVEATSTGEFAIWCIVMQWTSILQMRAAYYVNLQVKTSIDWKERDIWV